MTKPLIPPKGSFISSSVLFNADIPAPVLLTLIQLIALTWDNTSRMTPPLSFRAFSDLTRKSVRTIYGHISVLQNKHAALRLQTTGVGIFVVVLADWLFEPQKAGKRDCKSLQTPVKEEEEKVSIDSSAMELIPPPDSIQEEEYEGEPGKIAKFGKHKPPHKSKRVLSAGLRERLLVAGVFPNLLDEVAYSSYSEDDLGALLAWVLDSKALSPGGAFISRLRDHFIPPETYRQALCPYCGVRGGKHAADCRGRYLTGEYADFVEH